MRSAKLDPVHLITAAFIPLMIVLAYLLTTASGGVAIAAAVASGTLLVGIAAYYIVAIDVRAPSQWQLLFVLYFASGLVWRMRTTGEASQNPLDAAGLSRVLTVAVVAFVVLEYARAHQLSIGHVIHQRLFAPLFAFSLVCLFSTVWSVNKPWTLYRSVEYLVGVVLFAVVATHPDPWSIARRALNTVWVLDGLLLISVFGGVLLMPSQAIINSKGVIGFGVEGVIPNISSNGVGHIAGLLALVLLCRSVLNTATRSWQILLIPILLAVLIISQTRSAILAFLAGCIVLLIASKRLMLAAIIVTAICTTVALRPASTQDARTYAVRGENAQVVSTLTGRTDYWSLAVKKYLQAPLTGYGAYAGGRFLVASQFDQNLSSVHGTWPELLVDTGPWGIGAMGLTVLMIAASFWRLLRYRGFELAQRALLIEASAVFAFLLVRSVFSVTLIWHPALEFLVLVLVAQIGLKARRSSPS